jgi:predicted NUDIX family NTP pyrophosphohydrolase
MPVREMADTASDFFYRTVPRFERFADVADPARYRPLPADWLVGVADVVNSTGAIAAGRYKAVNIVGAGVITAVLNAYGGEAFPFAFGGDGAAFAVPGTARPAVEPALAAMRRWAADETGLELRAALIPVGEIRAAGLDVAVARFAVSPACDYAMFAGGGVSWADARMKAGAYAVPPAPPGSRPDLTALSCRWMPIASRQGEIVSLIVAPAEGADRAAFAALVRTIVAIVEDNAERAGHPVPADGPRFVWPPQAAGLEARARWSGIPVWIGFGMVFARAFLPWLLQATRRRLGRFDPFVYRRDATRNTDFRKFDDGLRLTLDCRPDLTARIEAVLERAVRDGIADFGLYRQSRALMTCIVPAPLRADHMHFVDGAEGGYARAAEMLKEAVARRRWATASR